MFNVTFKVQHETRSHSPILQLPSLHLPETVLLPGVSFLKICHKCEWRRLHNRIIHLQINSLRSVNGKTTEVQTWDVNNAGAFVFHWDAFIWYCEVLQTMVQKCYKCTFFV